MEVWVFMSVIFKRSVIDEDHMMEVGLQKKIK